jgi:hypothetical protein
MSDTNNNADLVEELLGINRKQQKQISSDPIDVNEQENLKPSSSSNGKD